MIHKHYTPQESYRNPEPTTPPIPGDENCEAVASGLQVRPEDITSVYPEPVDAAGWRLFLDKMAEARGVTAENPDGAAELLDAFTKGKNAVVERAHAQGDTEFSIPPTWIVHGDKTFQPSGFRAEDGTLHPGISFKHLSDMSRLIQGQRQGGESYSDTGEVAFCGSISDYFRLVGVEEADHILYERNRGRVSAVYIGSSPSLAEYDAQPHEYHSLVTRLMYARETEMPPRTIAVLEQRIDAAARFRLENL